MIHANIYASIAFVIGLPEFFALFVTERRTAASFLRKICVLTISFIFQSLYTYNFAGLACFNGVTIHSSQFHDFKIKFCFSPVTKKNLFEHVMGQMTIVSEEIESPSRVNNG